MGVQLPHSTGGPPARSHTHSCVARASFGQCTHSAVIRGPERAQEEEGRGGLIKHPIVYLHAWESWTSADKDLPEKW